MKSEILAQVERRLSALIDDIVNLIAEHTEKFTNEANEAAEIANDMMLAGTDRTREGIMARDRADAAFADHGALDAAVEAGKGITAALERVRRIQSTRQKDKAVFDLLIRIDDAAQANSKRRH